MARPAFQYDDPYGQNLWDAHLIERLLASHGLEHECGDLDAIWERMVRDPGSLPVRLFDTLARIRDLSTDAGHDALIAAVGGGPLFAADCYALSPRNLALRAWLDHRDAFLRVYARQVVQALRRYHEFAGKAALPIGLPDAETVARMQRWFGASFEKRGRSAHCRIDAYELDEQLVFDIGHGRPVRRDGALDERDGAILESLVEYRPQEFDRVVYYTRTGILRVTAHDAVTLRTYCQGFGHHLFGELGWFNARGVLTLEPLIERGREALLPVPGILDVTLTEVEILLPHGRGTSLIVRSSDVLSMLAEYGSVRLADGRLVGAKFAIRYASGGRPRTLTIRLDNLVRYDSRRDEEVTRRFLEERGFLAGKIAFEMAS